MAVSGLVVTLSPDDGLAQRAIHSLRDDPRLTLGERFGRRLALVAETGGVPEDRALWDDLHSTEGIDSVDVTFVALDEPAHAQEDSHDDRD